MKIECHYIVIVNKNGIWLDLMYHETMISTNFYKTWFELLEDHLWEKATRDEGPLRVRAAFDLPYVACDEDL